MRTPTKLLMGAYPLRFITPENDNPYDLHRLVEDLPHKVVTGTSHWLPMDKPKEFNRILDEFLEEILGDIK